MKLVNQIKVLGLSAIGAGLLAGVGAAPAAAISLVPSTEGEINVGVGAALGNGSYLSTSGFSVTSLVDSSTQTKSRLFVDKAGTSNTYGGVKFQSTDVGTADLLKDNWFRATAMKDATTTLVENGQLEVGTFTFNFNSPITNMVLRLFDTEKKGGTRYRVNDGDWVTVAAGADKNIFTAGLLNVGSLTLDLGERYGATGDGVLFQLDDNSPSSAAPEPMTMAGLALAGAGMAAARRRQRKAA
jgi:hypothetical protein